MASSSSLGRVIFIVAAHPLTVTTTFDLRLRTGRSDSSTLVSGEAWIVLVKVDDDGVPVLIGNPVCLAVVQDLILLTIWCDGIIW